ncbi:hypothetical protein [Kibdelosporangium philippinense]|uniref:hypothetical protein n=1 Tax=Kibdelosporangium philippinense TaxID=211113 RepID=UPI003621EA33
MATGQPINDPPTRATEKTNLPQIVPSIRYGQLWTLTKLRRRSPGARGHSWRHSLQH